MDKPTEGTEPNEVSGVTEVPPIGGIKLAGSTGDQSFTEKEIIIFSEAYIADCPIENGEDKIIRTFLEELFTSRGLAG